MPTLQWGSISEARIGEQVVAAINDANPTFVDGEATVSLTVTLTGTLSPTDVSLAVQADASVAALLDVLKVCFNGANQDHCVP